MAAPAPPRIVIDGDDGRTLAVAMIDVIDPTVVRASLHVVPWHLPSGTRSRLVDAWVDDPDVRAHHQVQLTVPLGDIEILDRVRAWRTIAAFRAAGSTCLVEAEPLPS